ncbi:TerB family tellurite resistance protein [Polymorphobacter sp.]|uniref:TerB family tellurite resistance protein n=1 Tax=Polymorphobacter sp. TaxID=1909290 RepID=UPI003F7151AA
MSIFASVAGAAAGLLIGGPLGALMGAAAAGSLGIVLKGLVRPADRPVAFTIAAIALAAKMAGADGQATMAEFRTFQRLFRVEPGEAENVQRFYDMAKTSTAGFEAYAAQAARLLGPGSPLLEDLLEALWLIAATDGFKQAELDYLDQVAEQLGIDPGTAAAIRARHIVAPQDDPWGVLGVPPGADPLALKRAYHGLVRQYHPDRHLAEGMPSEFIRVAEARMAAINAAYATLAGKDSRARQPH